MRLAEFSVKNFQFTIVIFLMAALLGLNALHTIPQAEDPTFPVASFTIVAVYPGATPADMEQLVVDPIEARMNELDDLKKLKSEIQDGLAVIGVEFEANAPADKRYDEVIREVNALRPTLPAEPGPARRAEVRREPSQYRAGGAGLGGAADVRAGGAGPAPQGAPRAGVRGTHRGAVGLSRAGSRRLAGCRAAVPTPDAGLAGAGGDRWRECQHARRHGQCRATRIHGEDQRELSFGRRGASDGDAPEPGETRSRSAMWPRWRGGTGTPGIWDATTVSARCSSPPT